MICRCRYHHRCRRLRRRCITTTLIVDPRTTQTQTQTKVIFQQKKKLILMQDLSNVVVKDVINDLEGNIAKIYTGIHFMVKVDYLEVSRQNIL
jgi:hypothetical protein